MATVDSEQPLVDPQINQQVSIETTPLTVPKQVAPVPVVQEKAALPTLEMPRKNSINILGYHKVKSQSESPFITRNKANKQRNMASNTSVKLDKIDEDTQGKNKARQNRSISPGMNKQQLINTLNQQSAQKSANYLPQRSFKVQNSTTSNESKSSERTPSQKALSNTLKLTNSISTQQSHSNLAAIPELSKSLLFQNQKLQGAQILLVPKTINQQTQPEAKLVVQKKPQTSGNLTVIQNNALTVAQNNDNNFNQFKYYIGGGNNAERIRKLLNKREGWSETKDATSMFVNLKWQQTTRGYKYEKLVENNNYKQVVNHFEFHREISNKQYLIKNLMAFSESMKQNVFDITPLTYIIDFNDENCDITLNNFLKFFEMNMPQHIKKKQGNLGAKSVDIKKLMRQFQAQYGQQSSEKLSNQFFTRWALQDTFLDKDEGTFMWLLKPTFLNRGRGIHVFNSLQSLEKLIADYTAGFEEKILKKSDKSKEDNEPANDDEQEKDDNPSDTKKLDEPKKEDPSNVGKENQVESHQQHSPPPSQQTVTEVKKINQNGNSFQIKKIKPLQQGARTNSTIIQQNPYVKKEKDDPNKYIRSIPAGPCILKASQFVVQKYIEKPLLIHNRKFDIRVWALVSHTMDVYFFREGYMRLSSSEFSTDESQLDNLFIHLTNNAIQKFSDSYGQFENGNMWTFKNLWDFLEKNYGDSENKQPASFYREKIVQKIKDIIFLTFCSVKKKLNQNDRKLCFEMFGFDFLIDAELNTWLIEVNTNPAIEECSAVTQALIPRALDDAFKITIDQIFQRKQFFQNPPQQQQQQTQNKNLQKPKEDQDNDAKEEQGKTQEPDINATPQKAPLLNIPVQQAEKKEEETFPIPGYDNDFNMWEMLGNLRESTNADLKKKYKQMK